ncbi:hypothetical protein L228DRAFT_25991 [Xylona heveae TC161]|uniref:PQ loop repeat protein n=1 Tax=Xylona heveae (strain CBS 132557 / TC161) TaxID=1328760 RepID=A0A165AE57_XYLHT|nr:hypothetical protein L228DRAFT_25991 [Xylona heveae TC161]KZF20329.1 hypothetical protein L228DRAFT_25991 [Xylona heveae TC161]
MGIVSYLITNISPLFLVISPITSYSDQIWSIHKTRTSQGFSLDIPLIMLVSCILRVFFWFGSRFDTALLVQALIMIVMQIMLLHVALTHRPQAHHKEGVAHTPFVGSREGDMHVNRPYNFWQWRSRRPYWSFLGYMTVTLIALQVMIGNVPFYVSLVGYLGLGIEAILPLPQVLANQKARSCKGFRFSVLASWLLGDVMKMMFFFFAESSIPWPFKMCGLFQMACDSFLGLQYWRFGAGPGAGVPAGLNVSSPGR